MNFFLSTGTRKGTANLRKFHLRKRDKSCSKDPYFLCHKTLLNGVELRQELSMRKLSNLLHHLSPFSNLSHGVFFLVELFFRRRSPLNITVAVVRNRRFRHLKILLCETVDAFSDNNCAIVSSRHVRFAR